VGKSDARRLLAEGKAEIPQLNSADDRTMLMENCGLVLWDNVNSYGKITKQYPALDYGLKDYGPEPLYVKNLIWDGVSKLDYKLIPLGFSRLDDWQLAVPVLDMTTLAQDLGTEEEREQIKEVIHDLRVPVYDTGIIFARRCPQTEKLFKLWDPYEGNRELGFIRALYQSCPVFLTLPVNWRDE